jgi:hypothetical protein
METSKKPLLSLAALALVASLCQAAEISPPAEPMTIWFTSPAKSFHESCPFKAPKAKDKDGWPGSFNPS